MTEHSSRYVDTLPGCDAALLTLGLTATWPHNSNIIAHETTGAWGSCPQIRSLTHHISNKYRYHFTICYINVSSWPLLSKNEKIVLCTPINYFVPEICSPLRDCLEFRIHRKLGLITAGIKRQISGMKRIRRTTFYYSLRNTFVLVFLNKICHHFKEIRKKREL